LAKFIPGISALAVPVASTAGISRLSFLSYDLLGSLLYVGTYLAIGRLLGDRVDKLSVFASSIKSVALALAIVIALLIVGWRFYQRRRFENQVKVARITPEEVLELIERGQNPYIVDLRHPLDMLSDPRLLPGAIRMTPEELWLRHSQIPRDREIILYCT
jgi:hypothetical protein